MENTINIQNCAEINAEGKLNSRHCKPVICIETGEVFTSVTDAANAIGCWTNDLSSHLTGKKRTIKGKHFCYLSKATESLDAIVTRLRETSTMEDDARKWRAYQAEQERIRKEEELRLENERKEKERHEAAVTKAMGRIDRLTKLCELLESQLMSAESKLVEAKKELNALLGKSEEEEEVA